MPKNKSFLIIILVYFFIMFFFLITSDLVLAMQSHIVGINNTNNSSPLSNVTSFRLSYVRRSFDLLRFSYSHHLGHYPSAQYIIKSQQDVPFCQFVAPFWYRIHLFCRSLKTIGLTVSCHLERTISNVARWPLYRYSNGAILNYFLTVLFVLLYCTSYFYEVSVVERVSI